MSEKRPPFSPEQIEAIKEEHPTPFYVYDEVGIRETARELNAAFDWAPGFRNYYAVKACPNPELLRILAEEGMGADASSLAELEIADRVDLSGEQVMFTSNNTPAHEFERAAELGAVINFDDITHIDYYHTHIGHLPEMVSLRFNPGEAKSGNAIIGEPKEAKYGLTRDQMITAYGRLRQGGVTRFGLHTMVASNERNAEYFVETARIVFELAEEVKERLGIEIELINLGGGLGIPYHPDDEPLDLEQAARGIEAEYATLSSTPRLAMESGRYVTGPHGFLITEVVHSKDTYKAYRGVDACMANLMRPGMYDAYHHITLLGDAGDRPTVTCDVVGGLCENNDKFAIDRPLPDLRRGDTVVIHDAGAHGHAMGFNYNGKLRSAEFLLTSGGGHRMIRRAETLADHFATLTDPPRL